MALKQFEALNGKEHLKDLVDHFDTTITKLNKYRANNKNVDEIKDKEVKQRVQNMIQFRKLVLNLFIEVGVPITAMSTGVEGIKWGSGFSENLHPMNIIPAFIDVDGERVALIKYDGYHPSGLTEMGRKLLSKLSEARGA